MESTPDGTESVARANLSRLPRPHLGVSTNYTETGQLNPSSPFPRCRLLVIQSLGCVSQNRTRPRTQNSPVAPGPSQMEDPRSLLGHRCLSGGSESWDSQDPFLCGVVGKTNPTASTNLLAVASDTQTNLRELRCAPTHISRRPLTGWSSGSAARHVVADFSATRWDWERP